MELPLLEELCLNRCDLSEAIVFSDPFPLLKTVQMQNMEIKSLSIKGNDLVEIDLSDCPLNAWGESLLDVPNLKVIHLTGLEFKDFKQLDCLPKNAEKMISVHLDREADLKTLISTLKRVNSIPVRLTGKKGSFEKVLEFMKALPNQVTQLNLR